MKFISISHLAPGVDSVKQAFELFGQLGAPDGTQALYASPDGKTFVLIVEADDYDMVRSASYAPFFDAVTVIPVVDVDDAWTNSMIEAIANMGD
jgi:hypothetical protein